MGDVKFSKAKYGWTKYGGARQGLVKQNGSWFCQACGIEHPDSLPAYMMCIDNGKYREFVRLCGSCEHLVKTFNIKSFETLKKIVAKDSEWVHFRIIFK